MRRPRVLVITPDFPPAKGGIQILAHRIVSSFEEIDPVVVTLGHPDASAFDRSLGFPTMRSPGQVGSRPFTVLGLNVAGVALALRQTPDVVLSTHIVASPAAAWIRHQLGVPFVQYVHAKEVGAKPGLARFALTRADRVVTVSRYTHRLAMAAGARPERVALINPGVDMPSAARPERSPHHPPTVLTISRLDDRYKGHDVLLQAMPLVRAEVPDARWRVIGDGPIRAMLRDRARTGGLASAVQFLGSVTDTVRDHELAHADVFCMVSRLPAGRFAGEGFGIVYLEASAHCLPIVAGAAGGATDAVVHGETGLLVDPEDHVAVADALVTLLRDHELSARLGSQGRARAASFTWQKAGARVEDELLRLVA